VFSWLYGLGGLTLVVAPCLSWRNVELLGLSVSLPGLLWHGAWIGLAGFLLAVFRRRCWLLKMSAWLAAALLTAREVRTVLTEGDRPFLQLQLKLSSINEGLGSLGIAPLELYRRTSEGWASLGSGARLALAALAAIALALAAELVLRLARGQTLSLALLGLHACPQCGGRVTSLMHFCPTCRCQLSSGPLCSRCGQPLRRSDRFCSACSEPVL